MTPVVVTHPARHPYLTHAIGLAPAACIDIWNLDFLRRADVRVVHVHFGFEAKTPSELSAWVGELHRSGIALVHTIHDLDNPHLADQTAFHESVGILTRGSAAVLTLTDSAASVAAERYGVRPTVVPHPHVVPLGDMVRAHAHARRQPRQGVYVHASTIRPNFDVELVERLADIACTVGGLRVHVRSTADPACTARLLALNRLPGVDVQVQDRLTDAELWRRLSSASLLVLPYRWSTHSGLLEAAHDLGTPVAAPAIGGLADQGAHPLDACCPAEQLIAATRHPPTTNVDDRRAQRDTLIAFHRDLYRAVAVHP